MNDDLRGVSTGFAIMGSAWCFVTQCMAAAVIMDVVIAHDESDIAYRQPWNCHSDSLRMKGRVWGISWSPSVAGKGDYIVTAKPVITAV